MSINIKATNMELTSAIEEYVNKRLSSVEKFFNNQDSTIHVEVGKTTNHHKNGDVYKAEFNVSVGEDKFFAQATSEDLYNAIDQARESISREMVHKKDRKQTLFKRGGASVKKMLKGLSKRNPFTSKY